MIANAQARIPFSLIVPAYNEEHRLKAPMPHVFEYLRNRFPDFEVLYVDDGSTDSTFAALEKASDDYPEIRLLRHERNYGKGRAVRTGIEAARGELILFSDADFSTPIEETEEFARILESGFDIVIGSRAVSGANVEIHQPLLREVTGRIGNAIVQTLLLLPFHDTQCGFKMFRANSAKAILPFLTIDGFGFDMEILAVATAHRMRICEAPVTWRNVLESRVKMTDTLRVLFDVLNIRYGLAVGKYI
jgi:dolichyl-phosphate beta-glucosyltransferase